MSSVSQGEAFPHLVISPTWSLMVTAEGLVEYRQQDELVSSLIQEHMLPLYRKMVYEWCVTNQQPSSKVEEIHKFFLDYTGRGL